MTAKILDGKAVSQHMRVELAAQVAALRSKGIIPGLGVLLAGDNPASRAYVTAKERACGELGIYSSEVRLPASASRAEVLDTVRAFNRDSRVHGILVQLPLPDASMEREVLETVDPAKDVDGFHPVNVGRADLGLPAFLPCTPHGILQLLRRSGIAVAGMHAVVIGRSHIVGRPLANLLSQKREGGNATVTLCHTATRNLAEHTRRADLVVAAAGRPDTVRADMIRDGAVVVDVGMNRVPDSAAPKGCRLVGDVAFDEVRAKASWITPVPGGVGPMTITMLLFNTVAAARGGPAEGG
ncbi:MAG: bifunctional 5,10-methylene-tetrahydrofolate dehydrogenase/5,10-methylene-tetrahydrofolate cyclohydrolase [Kiritimatiellae bacterium]|nr:bifunctional 5,10-methylene-tetrahydrofolate dehydrogenase/5,10-methylene-tetrahydrofolate cyclohydrolase [Kiritimatiellia bacterium]